MCVFTRWDVLMVMCVAYNCFMFPPRIAFGNSDVGPMFVADLVLDFIFLLDVLVNLNTGFDDNGTLEMRSKNVWRKYMSSWMFVDVFSSLPYDLVVYFTKYGSRMHLYARLPRIGRFCRLPRLFKYISNWQDSLTLNSHALRMFKLVFLILVFAHLDGCIQFMVAELEGFPQEGWVAVSGLLDAPATEQYSHSLFMALSHMLCIGYGREPPRTLAEIWVTTLSMVIGASFYIVLFGIMSSLMLSMDRSGAMYEERMGMWHEYFTYCKLPKCLRQRITAYLKHRYYTRKMFDESNLLAGLPHGLRTDIYMHLCEELILNVPIFKACRLVVVRALVSKMIREAYTPGDLLFHYGEPADNMYFILSGMIQIETEEGDILTVLSKGSYFGEFALLAWFKGDRTTHRMANARSVMYSDIYALSCTDFKEVADRFPEVVTLLQQIAEARNAVNAARKQEADKTEVEGEPIQEEKKDA
ncbi:hypothetical protein BSKO_07637 [Bryopsis sp. KO-2023]|nr:hypothetical protein BSKO_07637 [Bryopsis sp. KO-2023]